MRLRVPPGRAGRIWLRRRLAAVRHGLDVLDRKLRLLRREQDRLARNAERTGKEWVAACRAADEWLLRVTRLGGRRAVRLAAGDRTVDVRVQWDDALGTSYPARVACTLPDLDATPLLPITTALVPARHAYRAALRAGLEHAIAAEAARIVAADIASTRRRIRALEDRLLPALEQALAAVELSLDEMERADADRVRRIIGTEPELPHG
ncbi:V-type ATPase, D subunit [Nonomuraea sp. MG754425]|uniref:V-type ATP synthase subunit D n=1 Tax=Nonomuraea sp. MG754425 TaxID=2570319 RepID=UPI001F47C679|nr:V-type ATP synthase subunit D [Nonomuraea sp. MG754425]MCF6474619.1 V-type ATPase, D subunit [Nonomuraea sp. MG754425]